MYDSPNKLMLVYGVKATIGAPYLTSNGTATGLPTDYLFASYWNHYDYTTNFDPSTDRYLDSLRYLLSIGIAETDSLNQASAGGDANFLTVLNPTGLVSPPSSGRPTYQSGSTLAGIPLQSFSSGPSGLLEGDAPSNGLAGALTADGATLLVMRNTRGCDELGFGMGLRASRAGSFNTAGLKGTYNIAAFGDQFDTSAQTSLVRSTGGTIILDGAGHATLSLFENAGGILSSFNQSNLTYRVSQRRVPNERLPAVTVDVVDLFISSPPAVPYASALIGPNGQSLIFYHFLGTSGAANPTRLLGLALRQSPS